MDTERRVNWAGFSIETIAAQYETDAALAEWMALHPRETVFPPAGDYFNSAWRAENAEAHIDRMEGVRDEW